MQRSHWIPLGIAVVVLGIVAYFGYQFYLSERTARELPPEGTVVTFSDGYRGEQYEFADRSLVRVPDVSKDNNVVIYEEVQSPLSIEEKVILAATPDIGKIAGILKANGRITLLMTANTNKSELVAHKNLAVFTVAPEIRLPDPVPVEEGSEVNTPEHTFTSDGQEEIELPPPPSPGTYPELYLVELDTGAIRALGAGRSARFADDTTIVALAQNGIVRIDLTTLTRTLVLSHANAMRGALSPSGSLALVPSGDGASLDFYRIEENAAPWFGLLKRDQPIPFRAAFPDEEHFFLHTSGQSEVWYYNIPTEKLPAATPVAVMPIVTK